MAIEDVMTILLIVETFAADFRMPTVAMMAGSITSRFRLSLCVDPPLAFDHEGDKHQSGTYR